MLGSHLKSLGVEKNNIEAIFEVIFHSGDFIVRVISVWVIVLFFRSNVIFHVHVCEL